MQPIAHLDESGREHALVDHLLGVGRRAAEFAAVWNAGDWARLAGLWHDIGKFSAEFQAYIRGTDGAAAHLEGLRDPLGRVDHSTAGARLAVDRLGPAGRILAYAIAGHHAGLANWLDEGGGTTPLQVRLGDRARDLLASARRGSDWGAANGAVFDAPAPTTRPGQGVDPALWIRMLFSALVDADFLDTEAFYDAARADLRTSTHSIAGLLERLDAHLETLTASAAPTAVNRMRADVLGWCREAAARPPGLFSLTVPTGGGKTLASLAFALRHARAHGLRRVVYVIPYTSIIEQTASVFRSVLGDDAVLEHHSALDADKETPRSRVAAENWDAPVVVTTSVQFFESFFAARPGRCRKLHNVARSVVVLDEAHLLPPDLLLPALRLIEQLIRTYGTTVVLSTATQPALDRRPNFDGLAGRTEIVPDPAALARRMVRVRVRMPDPAEAPTSWDALARKLNEHDRILCIVDRRDDCRQLHALMGEDAFHLSALMCPAHRAAVLQEVKDRLRRGAVVRVISTQLVEAGVDIDFPVVYRAFAGLPSIAQAAGRCNREGRLSDLGEVVVFVSPSEPPVGVLRMARDVTRSQLGRPSVEPALDPAQFERFYRDFYWLHGERLDRHRILSAHLCPDLQLRFNFAAAAQLFRLIPDDESTVVVPWADAPRIVRDIEANGPDRTRLRKLQRFVVSLPRNTHDRLREAGAIRELAAAPGVFVLNRPHLYDPRIGLVPDPTRPEDPANLIV